MEKVVCYYHKVDLDGKCSAAIVRRKFPNCELIGVNYPDKPDIREIEDAGKVVIVDFSFEPEDMERLLVFFGWENVIWIDHYRSAIRKCDNYYLDDKGSSLGATLKGRREIGVAACELTWEHFFPDEPMPEAVRLLGRYDVWDHSDPDVLAFQYGMRLEEWSPKTRTWELLVGDVGSNCELDTRAEILAEGRVVLRYEFQQNKVYTKAAAFPVNFEGHRAWAINKYYGNSKIFEAMENADERPLWILFGYKNGKWRYSLYAAPGGGIDVSEIAVKYGGGGHAGAAGFRSDKCLLT